MQNFGGGFNCSSCWWIAHMNKQYETNICCICIVCFFSMLSYPSESGAVFTVFTLSSSHWDPVVSYSFNTCLLTDDGYQQSGADYFKLEITICRIAIMKSSIEIFSYLSIPLWYHLTSSSIIVPQTPKNEKTCYGPPKLSHLSPLETSHQFPTNQWCFCWGETPGDTFAGSFGGVILWAARALSTCKAK